MDVTNFKRGPHGIAKRARLIWEKSFRSTDLSHALDCRIVKFFGEFNSKTLAKLLQQVEVAIKWFAWINSKEPVLKESKRIL